MNKKKMPYESVKEVFDTSEIDYTFIKKETRFGNGFSYNWKLIKRTKKMENIFLDCFLAYDLIRYREDKAIPFNGFDNIFYLHGVDIEGDLAKNLCNFIEDFKKFISENYNNTIVIANVPYIYTGDKKGSSNRFKYSCNILSALNFKNISNYCLNENGQVYIYSNNLGNIIINTIHNIIDDPESAIIDFNIMKDSNYYCYTYNDSKVFYIIHNDIFNAKTFALNDISYLITESNIDLINKAIEIIGFSCDLNINDFLNHFITTIEKEYKEKFIFFSQANPDENFINCDEVFKSIELDDATTDYQISNYGTIIDPEGNIVKHCNFKNGPIVLLDSMHGPIAYNVPYLLMHTFHPSLKYDVLNEFYNEQEKIVSIFKNIGFLDINEYSEFEYSELLVYLKDENDMKNIKNVYEKIIKKGE